MTKYFSARERIMAEQLAERADELSKSKVRLTDRGHVVLVMTVILGGWAIFFGTFYLISH